MRQGGPSDRGRPGRTRIGMVSRRGPDLAARGGQAPRTLPEISRNTGRAGRCTIPAHSGPEFRTGEGERMDRTDVGITAVDEPKDAVEAQIRRVRQGPAWRRSRDSGRGCMTAGGF